MIRIGCSGWNYASWRESFYPKGLPASCWLEHYASVFDTVEVNTTFYRLARSDAVERWTKHAGGVLVRDQVVALKGVNYVTAPSEALETSFAYLPSTPVRAVLSGPT